MTQKELEIAQAACCVSTIWDQYEGTEEFNEMVGKRVQHLIELVRNHLEMEQPEVDLEKEANECWDYVFSAIGWDENSLMTMNHKEFLAFARHFYELRHNARKEERK